MVALEQKGGVTIEELAPLVSGKRGASVYETGDIDGGVWTAGMVAGLIHDIPTVKELVHRIVADAESLIRERLSGLLK